MNVGSSLNKLIREIQGARTDIRKNNLLVAESNKQMSVLIELLKCPEEAETLTIVVLTVGEKTPLWSGSMLIMFDDQKGKFTINPRSKAGNPATLGSVPVWTSSDPSVLTVVAAEDGLTADVATVGPVGNAQLQVTADADTSEGVRMITGTLDVEVRGGEAVDLGITAGVLEPRL